MGRSQTGVWFHTAPLFVGVGSLCLLPSVTRLQVTRRGRMLGILSRKAPADLGAKLDRSFPLKRPPADGV